MGVLADGIGGPSVVYDAADGLCRSGDDGGDGASAMGLPNLCARRRPGYAGDIQRSLRALDSELCRYLATNINNQVISQLGFELGLYVERTNQMSACSDAMAALKVARGAPGRVNADVAKTVGQVADIEQKAKDLAKAAVAVPLKEIGAVVDELNGMINEMAQLTNGGPDGPLPGSESQSTTSDGSTENPTKPQS